MPFLFFKPSRIFKFEFVLRFGTIYRLFGLGSLALDVRNRDSATTSKTKPPDFSCRKWCSLTGWGARCGPAISKGFLDKSSTLSAPRYQGWDWVSWSPWGWGSWAVQGESQSLMTGWQREQLQLWRGTLARGGDVWFTSPSPPGRIPGWRRPGS